MDTSQLNDFRNTPKYSLTRSISGLDVINAYNELVTESLDWIKLSSMVDERIKDCGFTRATFFRRCKQKTLSVAELERIIYFRHNC